MQRFTLLHDGSVQGWQATYMAFHVTAQLGAPLQVLHIDPNNDGEALALRAAHVETGGHAAGVAMETHLLSNFSLDTLKENVTAVDGFFAPQRLITDGETVSLFLDAFSCPLWIVSEESKLDNAAVLVNDPMHDTQLISYVKTLSHRLQQSLTALVLDEKFEADTKTKTFRLKVDVSLNILRGCHYSRARTTSSRFVVYFIIEQIHGWRFVRKPCHLSQSR